MKRMISFSAVLMLMVTMLGGRYAHAADDLYAIPPDVLRPAVEAGETAVMWDDFDGNASLHYQDGGTDKTVSWSAGAGEKVETVGEAGGNHIARAAESYGWPSLGWGEWYMGNSIMKCNMRVSYPAADGADWVQIAKLRMRWSDEFAKVMLYRGKGESSGKLIYEQIRKVNGKTQSSNWTEMVIENFDEVFNDKWNYWQFEMYDNKIILYLNSTTEPMMICKYENPNGSSGALGFENANAALYLDNFLLVTRDYTRAPVPQLTPGHKAVYQQNFESYNPVVTTNDNGSHKMDIWNEIWSYAGSAVKDGYGAGSESGAYDFKGEYNSEDFKLTNFTLECNLKISETASAWPEISWNLSWNPGQCRYKSYIDTSTGTFSILKVVNGKEEWDTLQTAEGPGIFNFSEMNDKWAYFKAERTGNIMKLYYNDKEKPFLIVTDPSENPLSSGCFKIADGDADKMYIDNLLITAAEPEPDFEVMASSFSEEPGAAPGTAKVTAALRLCNRTAAPIPAALVLAAFEKENGALAAIAVQEEISVPVTQDDAPAEALESVTVKGNMDSYTYRVYLWDSVDNMTPLTGSISPDGPPADV